MMFSPTVSFLRKLLRNRGKALHRLRKKISGNTVSLFRPKLANERPGNVVMFHIGRSGSTVLSDMLDQHPSVYWDGEIYHPLLKKGVSARLEPLEILARRMLRAGKKYYGFEIKPVHLECLGLDPDKFIQDLRQLKFSYFIVLERKNHLRKIISSVIAHQSGVFHRSSGESWKSRKVVIDAQSVAIDNDVRPLLHWLHAYNRFFSKLRQSLDGLETLWLTYEDDVYGTPENAFRKVCTYLNLEKELQPEVRYEKTNPFALNDLVENFDAIESGLRGTEFEWMLYE